MQKPPTAGFTLVEIIVALLVFTIGALALAASSALVARALGRNAERDRAARFAVSRIELLRSQCATAASGSETIEQMQSEWVVSRSDSLITITETVRCLAPLSCVESHRSVIWCGA